jgi:hypothetical protein
VRLNNDGSIDGSFIPPIFQTMWAIPARCIRLYRWQAARVGGWLFLPGKQRCASCAGAPGQHGPWTRLLSRPPIIERSNPFACNPMTLDLGSERLKIIFSARWFAISMPMAGSTPHPE